MASLGFPCTERHCLGFLVSVTLFTEKLLQTLYKSRAGGLGQPFQDRVDSWIVGGRSPVLGQTHQAQPWTIFKESDRSLRPGIYGLTRSQKK